MLYVSFFLYIYIYNIIYIYVILSDVSSSEVQGECNRSSIQFITPNTKQLLNLITTTAANDNYINLLVSAAQLNIPIDHVLKSISQSTHHHPEIVISFYENNDNNLEKFLLNMTLILKGNDPPIVFNNIFSTTLLG